MKLGKRRWISHEYDSDEGSEESIDYGSDESDERSSDDDSDGAEIKMRLLLDSDECEMDYGDSSSDDD